MSETPLVTGGNGRRHSILPAGSSVLRLVAINLIVCAVLVELVCVVYINVTNWPGSKPTYRLNYKPFWADINPAFGVWHPSNGDFFHATGCYSVEYVTNSYGARDIERRLHSSLPRTVVLGDSFIEGYGLPAEDRLSNVLERDTGVEHLNFGTGGTFGPLQYALLYKTMAAAFDHDTVLVGVLPDNDFHDMSLSWGKAHDPGRYRPYYADDFSIVYQGRFQRDAGQKFWDHFKAVLRAYVASYHVGDYIHARLNSRAPVPYSGYNDYTDVDLTRLQKAMQNIKITADAHGARMAVFLIPRANDFLRWHEKGTNRLGPVMERWGHDVGIPVKDLLPDMDARCNGDYASYFHSCDGHWSARGNSVAADILEPWLGEEKVPGR